MTPLSPHPHPHPDPATALLPNGNNSNNQNQNQNHNHTTATTPTTEIQPEHQQPEKIIEYESDPSIPPLSAVAANLHDRVQAFLAETHHLDAPNSLLARVQQQTRTALDVISTALSRYRLSELSLSYNGGKDCLVLLILFLASLHPLDEKKDGISSIPAIYALPPHPFPSVEEFVRRSSRQYHLELTRYTTEPPRTTLRSAFASYLALNPSIRAIFVGTRRTDPHGAKLTHFDRTDHGWPDFVRIHPVIDWRYAEIWAFIRHLSIEYCSLYDEGYTSLGGTNDTHPNPKLRVDNPEEAGGRQYRPAYELTEDDEERLGRD